MTQASTVRGVDSDRVDGGRRPWRPAAAVLVAGLLLGGLAGGFYGAGKRASYRAVISLSVLPDSAVTSQVPGTPAGAPAQDATSFIQSQLVVLNGAPLRSQVQQQLKLRVPPDLSSSQIAQTYVVQVAATAPVRARALDAANAAGQAYAALRRKQLGSDVGAAITSVQTQVASVRDSLASAPSVTSVTGSATPESAALRDEYERLLAVSSALELSRGQVDRAVTTVTPANISPTGTSPKVKDAVAGALLAALLGFALLIVTRRALPRIRTVGDLTALGLPVLLPALPRRATRGRHPRGWRSSQGRLLASRLGGGPAAQRPIVVLGATRSVGVSYVTTVLGVALVERAPVLLVLAAEAVHGSVRGRGQVLPHNAPSALAGDALPDVQTLLNRTVRSTIPGMSVLALDGGGIRGLRHLRELVAAGLLAAAADSGWIVVVDAPALCDSDLGLDLARAAGGATLVAGRSRSRPAELLGAAELFDAQDQQLHGVIMNDVPRRSWLPARAAELARTTPAREPGTAATPAQLAEPADTPSPVRPSASAEGNGRPAAAGPHEPVEAGRSAEWSRSIRSYGSVRLGGSAEASRTGESGGSSWAGTPAGDRR